MEEIIRNIVMIACTSFVVGFLLLAVVGIVGLLCETIREHNDSKPIQSKKRNKRKLNQDEIKHLYAQLKYYLDLVDYYREEIDKIRREK